MGRAGRSLVPRGSIDVSLALRARALNRARDDGEGRGDVRAQYGYGSHDGHGHKRQNQAGLRQALILLPQVLSLLPPPQPSESGPHLHRSTIMRQQGG